MLRTSARTADRRRPTPHGSGGADLFEPSPGSGGEAATVEIAPPAPDALRITYAPQTDGDPDAGEVVWTWVPYQERDGRGKDRPVLVIARRDADHVYAVKLTSQSHDGDRDFLSIGAGAWDSKGRPSWVDVDQMYLVHRDGMRREAAALDAERFARVAALLHKRYGWALG
ncbi:type II toxin-antitoxin system PemK/MazF family toxin [Microbacterium protaetiae]|uniref:Type II toxin-antitoxin system PemK/MazF family toxin n=2 Tax=Microbacterium protaetiae TaxID=2509458 RepID=A0A4P6EHG5_9MICO|nr:type II toxin-antitoxin system PemK/MazF family toxin [Microbacterium protaetiae]